MKKVFLLLMCCCAVLLAEKPHKQQDYEGKDS